MLRIITLKLLLVVFSAPLYAGDCTATPHRTTGTHYEPVTEHKINISKLQSFPVLGQVNTYYFHLDLEFDDIGQYEDCIDEVRKVSSGLEELGVYKKAIIHDHQTV